MKNLPETDAGPTAPMEQGNELARRSREEPQKEAAVFAAQLAELERKYAAAPALLKMPGRAFGFGADGKLGRARFKVSYERARLAKFESLHSDGRPER
jgi:hypothetical protein